MRCGGSEKRIEKETKLFSPFVRVRAAGERKRNEVVLAVCEGERGGGKKKKRSRSRRL